MKIKDKGIRKKKTNSHSYYSWMVDEKPKRKSRLPQLNKANHIAGRKVGKSELVSAAERVEFTNPVIKTRR